MVHKKRIRASALAAIVPLMSAVAICGVRAAGQEQVEAGKDPYAGKSCLSSGCHADLSKPKFVHLPVKSNMCAACHEETDEQNHKFALVAEAAELCYECHDESEVAEAPKGGSVHQPVVQGSCASCHEPHSSDNKGLLVEAYSEDYYVPIEDADQYALCFECHDYELIDEAETDSTEFRNGERNLHYLHVNMKQKGRSCRICHDAHVSAEPRLIRTNVPFGKWTMNLRFVPTKTGGACGPSCHSPKQYDREEPYDVSKAPSIKEVLKR
jgi:predicted CXXCH cytochrome family protein